MRRRSGAIHCETIQEYLQMAEVAQNEQGIFYDEKVNQKLRQHLSTKMEASTLDSSLTWTNPSYLALSQVQFANFQFNPQSEQLREQSEELQRVSDIQTLNLAFLSRNTGSGYEWLKKYLSLSGTKDADGLYLDVQVIKKGKLILKCWLFEKDKNFISIDAKQYTKQTNKNRFFPQQVVILQKYDQKQKRYSSLVDLTYLFKLHLSKLSWKVNY